MACDPANLLGAGVPHISTWRYLVRLVKLISGCRQAYAFIRHLHPLLPNATPWSANCAGQETLVNVAIVSAQGNVPLVSVWDRGVFTILNPDEYPASYWNNSTSIGQIQGAWGLDYASSNTNFFTTWEGQQNVTPGYSSDGAPLGQHGQQLRQAFNIGGAIAASTPNNWIAVTGFSDSH